MCCMRIDVWLKSLNVKPQHKSSEVDKATKMCGCPFSAFDISSCSAGIDGGFVFSLHHGSDRNKIASSYKLNFSMTVLPVHHSRWSINWQPSGSMNTALLSPIMEDYRISQKIHKLLRVLSNITDSALSWCVKTIHMCGRARFIVWKCTKKVFCLPVCLQSKLKKRD